MKFFEKRSVAWITLAICIVLGLLLAVNKQPSYAGYEKFIDDQANLLSASTKAEIEQLNQELESSCYAKIAVVTRASMDGYAYIEDYAYDLYEEYNLNNTDMLLLMVKDVDWYIDCSSHLSSMFSESDVGSISSAMNSSFSIGNYDKAVTDTLKAVKNFYSGISVARSDSDAGIAGLVVLLLFIFVVLILIDRARYNRYRRRYYTYGTVNPTVVYYPIFWGRHHIRPWGAPPPPHRGPMDNHFGGPRPGGFGPGFGGPRPGNGNHSSFSSSGFGGFSGGGHGGGFGGSGGGSFGGGSFGGGHGGGFSGGGHGGGFGGGGRH